METLNKLGKFYSACRVKLATAWVSWRTQAVKEEELSAHEALPVVGSNLAAAWEQGAKGVLPQAQVIHSAFLLLSCRTGVET